MPRQLAMDDMEYTSDALAQVAYVTNATKPEIVTQSDLIADTTGAAAVWSLGGNALSQGFKVTTTDDITKFTFRLYRGASAITGTITGYIYSDTGGVPNVAVATFSNIAASSVSGGTGSDIEFTGTFTPVVGTQYHIVVVWTGGTAGDYFAQRYDSTVSYVNGNGSYRENTTWNTSATFEAYFKIYQLSGTPNFQSYSESTIKTQGSYSLKGIASITDSLNKTLTKTISPTIDLTGVNNLKFDIRASRTGSNIKIGIRDSGGTITEIIPNIITANTWQTVNFDLSAVSAANKDAIDSIIITIVNADAANTFYIDYFEIAQAIDIFGII
jgi:hypothetical protein